MTTNINDRYTMIPAGDANWGVPVFVYGCYPAGIAQGYYLCLLTTGYYG